MFSLGLSGKISSGGCQFLSELTEHICFVAGQVRSKSGCGVLFFQAPGFFQPFFIEKHHKIEKVFAHPIFFELFC